MNKYIDFLSFLYESNKGEYIDVIPYLIDKFPFDSQSFEVKAMLILMSESALISLSGSKYNELGKPTQASLIISGTDKAKPVTLRELNNKTASGNQDKILAKITYKGVSEIYSHRLNESIKTTNNRNVASMIIQAFLAFAIVATTIFQARISYLQFEKEDTTEKKVEQLQKSSKELQELLRQKIK